MKIFILPLLFISTVQAALVDRVVIEVNSIAYTQRQIELFIAVFDAISNEMEQNVRTVGPSNWQEVLNQFESFMLVEQEAHRLGSYLPSNNMIEKGFEIYQEKVKKDAALKEIAERLKANEKSVKKSIISVLRVAAFLRSKQSR